MKKKLLLLLLCIVGIRIVLITLIPSSGTPLNMATNDYNSSVNMKSSLADIQSAIKSMYSGSKYKSVSVSTTYDSTSVICDNISQSNIAHAWNDKNPNKKVSGVCGIVSNTMLLQKYMDLTLGKLPNKYSKEDTFYKQVDYAWGKGGIFSSEKKEGTTAEEEKKLLNYFLDTYEKSKYKANIDNIGLWSTCKDYFDTKVRPVKLTLKGKLSDGTTSYHSVLGTAGYIEKVTYKTSLMGLSINHTEEYEIARICNGWMDSEKNNWAKTTNKYIFFDCVTNIIKLK